ncbi:MAG: nickel-dependent hydrogenase large subunit [Alphaproteobacteria bacterium]
MAVGLRHWFRGDPLAAGHRPWPRWELSRARWEELRDHLPGADWSLLGLWAEPSAVHAAFRDDSDGAIGVVSLACPERRFPSLSTVRPSAIRLERTAQDLYGLVAEGLIDGRPWLDHGRFPAGHSPRRDPAPYDFLPADGKELHQIPVGPVHAGIIEPGHFRFHANGETVARLEVRLGYVHKGVERLMAGKLVLDAARLAARLSGDSTVAHSLAFARAVEAALEIDAPPRAAWLRAVMAELERMANHFGDIGAIANDASFTLIHAHSNVMREKVLRASDACFGHRLMMDRIVPGGVAVDLRAGHAAQLQALMRELRRHFEDVVAAYDNKPSLLDRTLTTGIVDTTLVHRFAPGGFVGRASGRGFDARRSPSYPPYDALSFEVPVRTEGDVHARLWIRIDEARQSMALVENLCAGLPGGRLNTALPTVAGEGMALVESFRGEIMTWVRLNADGTVARCHPRDPSWFQWPLLEAAIADNIVADFPLCNKSFNCSYSGHDL